MSPIPLAFALIAVAVLSWRSKSTDIIDVLNAKPQLRGAAMANQDEWFDPDLKAAVDGLLASANHLCLVQDREVDDGVANFLTMKIREIRDLATILLPPEEDWPSNVVPFRPRVAN